MQLTPSIQRFSKASPAGGLRLRSPLKWLLAGLAAASFLQGLSAQECNCADDAVDVVLRGTIPKFKVTGGEKGPAPQIRVQIKEDEEVEFTLSTEDSVGCEFGTVSFSCGLEYELLSDSGAVTGWTKGKVFSADTVNNKLNPAKFKLRRIKEEKDSDDENDGGGGGDPSAETAPPAVSNPSDGSAPTMSPAGLTINIPLGNVALGASGGAPFVSAGVLSAAGPIAPALAKPDKFDYRGLEEVAGRPASVWGPTLPAKVTFTAPAGYPNEKHLITPTRLFRLTGYSSTPSLISPLSTATSTYVREYVRGSSTESAATTLGTTPISWWQISPVTQGVKIDKSVNGAVSTVTYTAPSTGELTVNNGVTATAMTVVPPSSLGQSYSVQALVSRSGNVISKNIRTYIPVGNDYQLGDETVFLNPASSSSPQTTSRHYYPSGGAAGLLWWESKPDGSWTVYQYDSTGNAVIYTPFQSETLLDPSHTDVNSLPIISAPGFIAGTGRLHRYKNPVNGPHRTPENATDCVAPLALAASTFSTDWALYRQYDSEVEIDAFSTSTDAVPDDLPVKVKGQDVYYGTDIPSASPSNYLAGRLILTIEKNKNASYFQYQKSGDQLTVTETTGVVTDQDANTTADIWLFQTVPNLSQRTVSIYGPDGIVSREVFYHTGSGFTSARLLTYYYQNGVYQRTESGGVVLNRIDRPDPLTLVQTDSRGQITTSKYDSSGSVLWSEKSGGGGVPPIRTTYEIGGLVTTTKVNGTVSSIVTKDGLGRTISRQDESGAVTTYQYLNGGRDIKTILPGGIIQLEEHYLDGSVRDRSGSGWIQEFRSLGVSQGSDGFFETATFGSSVSHSSRGQVNYYDSHGFRTKEIAPSPAAQGGTVTSSYSYYMDTLTGVSRQQSGSVDPFSNELYFAGTPSDTPAVIMGADVTEGIDVNRDDALDLSHDRIRRRFATYELSNGVTVRKIREYSYPTTVDTDAIVTETIDSLGFISAGSGSYSYFHKVTQPSGRSVTQTTTVTPATGLVVEVEDDSATTSTVDKRTTQINGYTQTVERAGYAQSEKYTYDSLGRVKTFNDHRNAATITYYQTNSAVASVVDQLGRSASYAYYGPGEAHAGLLKSITYPGGVTEQRSYNDRGQLTQIGGSSQYAQDMTYDDFGKLLTLQTHGAQAALTRWTYQAGTGLLASKRFNDGNSGSKGFDYEYTSDGMISKRTSGRGIITDYTYDPDTRDLTGITYSDSITPNITYGAYDSMGRPHTISEAKVSPKIDPHTNSQTISYDPYTGLPTVTYSTSAHRWLKKVQVGQNRDSFGRPAGFNLKVDNDIQSIQSYHYDAYSRIDQVNSLDLSSVLSRLAGTDMVNDVVVKSGASGTGAAFYERSLSIDLLGRVVGVVNKAGSSAASLSPIASVGHLYDSAGRRSTARREDGSWWNYQYNDRSEVISAVKKSVANNLIPGLSYSYSYDGMGNRTSSSSGTAALVSRGYTPDALNQYDAVTHSGGLNILTRSDATVSATAVNGTVNPAVAQEGNLNGVSVSADNATAGKEVSVTLKRAGVAKDTVASWVPAANVAPSYDADGNLIGDGRWTYGWDAENRLVSMNPASTAVGVPNVSMAFEYDWMGRRIGKSVTTDTTTVYTSFAYDGWNPIAEWSRTSVGADLSKPLRTYLWGPDQSSSGKVKADEGADFQKAGGVGGLIASTYYNTDGSKEFCVPGYDANGNVISWSNNSGTVLARMDYDPFGNTVLAEKFASATTLGKIPSFGFSTKLQDIESGLYYYGYRYYDPATGRWISRDPSHENGGINLYGFVKNNPISGIDRLGLKKVKGRIQDGKVGWNYSFDAKFDRKKCDLMITLHIQINGVSDSDKSKFDDYFKTLHDKWGNRKYAVTDCCCDEISVGLFVVVNSGEDPDQTVNLDDSGARSNMTKWHESDPNTWVHETLHMLGLKDEYLDPEYYPDKKSEDLPPGANDSVMNDQAGPILDRQVEEVAERANTGCKFVPKATPVQDDPPPGTIPKAIPVPE